MKIGNRDFRAQSAMEYLMTYGWAILIIAVVLAALFSLNVFSPHLGTACIGQPGYSCSAPIISSSGVLSFTLGLATGSTAYDVVFACTASSNTFTAASVPFTIVYPANYIATGTNTLGSALTAISSTASLASGTGAPITVTGVQCWPNGGAGYAGGASIPTTFAPIGTPFTGVIWMGYTSASGTLPYSYIQIAKFSASSSS